MSLEELESEALKLDPKARARLAGKLIESLENLSVEENARLWADEAQRRDADMTTHPGSECPADKVFRDVQTKLK